MKYSLSKLRKLSNLPLSILDEEIIDALVTLGFEVETQNHICKNMIAIFGEILSIDKHPKSKNDLFILKINIGKNKIQIVTTAKVNIGEIVAILRPDSIINDQKLTKKNFLEVESDGMLLGYDDIFSKEVLPDNFIDNVVKVDDKTLIGTNVFDHLDFSDNIIDINILPDRSDVTGHWILSYEIATYFGTSPKEIPSDLPKEKFQSTMKVKNLENNVVSLFEAKISKITSSNLNDQLLLIKLGVKPINKIIDATNLTWILFGVPTHVYDKKMIGNDLSINVSSGQISALNNIDYKVDDLLVIESNKEIISLAGVIGSKIHSVLKTTTHIVFEIGNFEPHLIRETMSNLKIETDASTVFSKKISKNLIKTTHIFLKSIFRDCSNSIGIVQVEKTKIKMNDSFLNEYAGFDIYSKFNKIKMKLKSLKFELDNDLIIAPFYRHDIYNFADIVEEIFRLYGYDNFPNLEIKSYNKQLKIQNQYSYKNAIASLGYNEVINYSLTSIEANEVDLLNLKSNLKLKTYISNDRIVYRNSITQSLLKLASYHLKRKMEDFNFFETSYIGDGNLESVALVTTKSFFDLKKDIETIFSNLVFKRSKNTLLHKGVSADIFDNDNYVGFIGQMNPNVNDVECYIAEIIIKPLSKKDYTFKKYETTSLQVKDFNLEVDTKSEIGSIILNLYKEIDEIHNIKIIDEFNKEQLKVITIRIWFRFIKDFDQINEKINKIFYRDKK